MGREFDKLKIITEGSFKGWWQYGANRLSPELYDEIFCSIKCLAERRKVYIK